MKKSMRKPVVHRSAGLRPIRARLTPQQQVNRAKRLAERDLGRLASGLHDREQGRYATRQEIEAQPGYGRTLARLRRRIRVAADRIHPRR